MGRPHADRLCFLVDDALPHGYGEAGDSWPEGCPCQATPNGVVELLNGHRMRLNAVSLTANASLVRAFRELAQNAGGRLTEAPGQVDGAVHAAGRTLAAAGVVIESSRAYMAAAEALGSGDLEIVAPAMPWPGEATRSIAEYLRRRGLLGKRRTV